MMVSKCQSQSVKDIRDMPIEEVAAKMGIEVVRHKALCPFHQDRHPSLHFDIKRNRYKCFSCGASGNVIDLVMRYMNIGFKEAISSSPLLTSPRGGNKNASSADWGARSNQALPLGGDGGGLGLGAGLDIEYLSTLMAHPIINSEAAHFLYDERKIDQRVVRWCGISSISEPTPCWRFGKTFYDAPSLLIPYRDVDGKLLSVQGRYMGKEDKPRFRFPRGSHVGMYNKPVIRRLKPGDELWIAEGPSDCWALLSAGHKAVAIPSATSLTKADIGLLRERLPEGVSLHMYPDNDEPGMKLFEDLKRWFPQLKGHVLPEGCKDFGEFYKLLNFRK